jgi:hypothetical protein
VRQVIDAVQLDTSPGGDGTSAPLAASVGVWLGWGARPCSPRSCLCAHQPQS